MMGFGLGMMGGFIGLRRLVRGFLLDMMFGGRGFFLMEMMFGGSFVVRLLVMSNFGLFM